MRYEPYRMAKNEELCLIVYRRVLAAIDWVEYLAEMVDGLSNDDKVIFYYDINIIQNKFANCRLL